jgi:ABC-type antimicrobial peptide transport system permease subunit
VGLYGVVSFGVEQRRAAIGVRLALGADAGRLQRGVLRDGLALAGLGVALGLPAAFAASRLLESQLFETSPADPLSYATVSLLLLVIAGVATLLPARRATRVDPLEALRTE